MYKKFVFLVLTIPSLLFIGYAYLVLNYKMLYMDHEYPMWLEVKNTVNKKTTNKIDLIVLGDSRAKAAFIPKELKNISSINLSIGGGTPVEGYFTLKKYLKNNSTPKKIIFSYTPTHLSGENLYWSRTVSFQFLTDNEYKNIELLAFKLDEKPIIKYNKKFTDYKYPIAYASSFKNGMRDMRWLRNKIVLKECQASEGHHFFGTAEYSDGLNDESKENIFLSSKLQDYYFNEMLNLAKSYNIALYFYIMPINKSSFDKMNAIYVKGYEDYIEELSLKYDMKLCNKVFYMENSNFGDPSHLFRGAKKNTMYMYKCVDN